MWWRNTESDWLHVFIGNPSVMQSIDALCIDADDGGTLDGDASGPTPAHTTDVRQRRTTSESRIKRLAVQRVMHNLRFIPNYHHRADKMAASVALDIPRQIHDDIVILQGQEIIRIRGLLETTEVGLAKTFI